MYHYYDMFNITIVAIGKIKKGYWQEALSEYEKRLKPYAKIRFEEIAPEPICVGDKERTKDKEAVKISRFLAKYPKNEIFLLEEKGKVLDSKGLSCLLRENNEQAVFVVGGALGFSRRLSDEYFSISLSRLTFPHELARVILLEQIYRAAAIVNGKEYHY